MYVPSAVCYNTWYIIWGMSAPARRRGVAHIAQPPVVTDSFAHGADRQPVRRSTKSKRYQLNKEKQV